MDDKKLKEAAEKEYPNSHNHCRIYANTPFGISWEYATNGETTLNAIWLCIIEFINFYNSQTKQ